MESATTKEIKQEEPKLNIKEYLIHLFDIRDGTSIPGTIQSIKKGILIKGHTAWLLMLSILIASIGLNISSTAVVIGAMLIAPLMGPILGIGLSIATNDAETFKKSLLNFVAMVVISLVTSFLFFSIPLFQEATPELLARTKPDLRDVLIAIVGGLALIISLSRRKEMLNTLAGVAIATALMPPICTAGYGLAVGNLNYFFGAFFLFIINTNFIALATYVILKFLGFKNVKQVGSKNQKLFLRIATFVTFIVFSLSIFTFYKLYEEKKFINSAKSFIELIKAKGINVIDIDDNDFDFKNNSITIAVFGKNIYADEKQELLQILNKVNLKDTKLYIQQEKDNSNFAEELDMLKKAYTNQLNYINLKDKTIQEKDLLIQQLKLTLDKNKSKIIPFEQLSKEARINYDGLKSLSYSNKISTNFNTIDTTIVFSSQWYDTIPNTDVQFEKLEKWLKTRIQENKIKITKEN